MKDSSNHSMITRSKKKETIFNHKEGGMPPNDDEEDDIDENGNLKGFIDYECEENDFDNEMFQKELSKLRKGNQDGKIKKEKYKKNKRKKNNGIQDILLPYMLLNILGNGKPTKKKNKKNQMEKVFTIKDNINIEVFSEDECVSEDEEEISDIELDDEDEGENMLLEEELLSEEESICSSIESSDEDIEMDEYDEIYNDLEEEGFEDFDKEFNYFQTLKMEEKKKHIETIQIIKQSRNTSIPLKFKILNSEMDLKTKTIAITNVEKLNEMDVSTGEYCKMDKWINGLINIPFGKYINLPISNENTETEKKEFLISTQKCLNSAIFGHYEAKMHILQVIGKWIKNPQSQGNVLAIQGPMGNGKTTLVKEGISKAINRPFAFIALGGASDSAFFDGHSYTYEGSHWGRIVDILIESKCMNPIIYFDELDKISDTHKGDEIVHLLTHLTDPSQNTLFQDNYFPGIHLNLSKALFIFSFNDESKLDPILKDRMYVINTKGFKPEEKISICRDYLLPELTNTFLFKENDIIFSDQVLNYIIDNYTHREEGVRNLKRCLETIISKINIYSMIHNTENEKTGVNLTFTINDFKIPLSITVDIINSLLTKVSDDKPPEHMYM